VGLARRREQLKNKTIEESAKAVLDLFVAQGAYMREDGPNNFSLNVTGLNKKEYALVTTTMARMRRLMPAGSSDQDVLMQVVSVGAARNRSERSGAFAEKNDAGKIQ
jgi:hypothetical protein